MREQPFFSKNKEIKLLTCYVINVLLNYYSDQQGSGGTAPIYIRSDVNTVIILICRGMGVQPPGTRRSKLIRNNKNNQFFKRKSNDLSNIGKLGD